MFNMQILLHMTYRIRKKHFQKRFSVALSRNILPNSYGITAQPPRLQYCTHLKQDKEKKTLQKKAAQHFR